MSDELDLDWAKGQIAAAKVPAPVGKATLALLRAWGELSFPNEAQQTQAIDLFGSLARNEAVVEEETDAVWKPVFLGFDIQVGQTVRVRKDAFADKLGRTHNGRVGRVIAKRSGDIIVRTTDDREPYLDSAHYDAKVLEIKVR